MAAEPPLPPVSGAWIARARERMAAALEPSTDETTAIIERCVKAEREFGFQAGWLAGYQDGLRDERARVAEQT